MDRGGGSGIVAEIKGLGGFGVTVSELLGLSTSDAVGAGQYVNIE